MIEDLRDILNYETSLTWILKRKELVGSIFEFFTYNMEHSEVLITRLGGSGD